MEKKRYEMQYSEATGYYYVYDNEENKAFFCNPKEEVLKMVNKLNSSK